DEGVLIEARRRCGFDDPSRRVFVGKIQHDAESEVAVSGAGWATTAERTAHAGLIAFARPAPLGMRSSGAGVLRIDCIAAIGSITVQTQLPDVPMSYRPQRLGLFVATSWVSFPLFASYQAKSPGRPSPKLYGLCVPARQAYSHSASV